MPEKINIPTSTNKPTEVKTEVKGEVKGEIQEVKTEVKGDFIPLTYKKQRPLSPEEVGKFLSEADAKTGYQFSIIELSEPSIPSGKTVIDNRKVIYHKVGKLNGERVSYTVLGSDKKTVLESKEDCKQVDR